MLRFGGSNFRGAGLVCVGRTVAGAVCFASMATTGAFVAVRPPMAAAASPTPLVRVGNWNAPHSIFAFPLTTNGNVAPTLTITNSPTKGYTGLAYDGSGDLWAANTLGGKIVEFTPSQLGVGGTQAPAVSLTVSDPVGIAFDGTGNLWVAEGTSNQVVEYSRSSIAHSGTPSPTVVLSSDSTTPHSLVNPFGLAFDGSGNLWVSNLSGSSIVEFTLTQISLTGSPRPHAVLKGPTTHLTDPNGLAFDALGNLWVADSSSTWITKFTPTELATGGNQLPASHVVYRDSWNVEFDNDGDLWASFTETNAVGALTPAQQEAGGTQSPALLIKGTKTGLESPEGLALSVPPSLSGVTPASGAVSSTVTLHGTGFTSSTTVKFGSVEATTVHVVSPFTITAKVPAGSGTVTVTTSTFAGTSGALPFTYPSSTSAPTGSSPVQPFTGYDLAGSDGGVFVFPVGQASGFYGSLPSLHVVPVAPIVGLVPTVTDKGYFLVGDDGGVFAFGTAPFLGSLPGKGVVPTAPITGIVAANADKGYFLVGKDGGVFAFGTVPFLGSLPGKGISVDNIIGIASTPSGNGYWVVSATGTVYGFGSAQHLGTAKGTASPVSAIAGTPTGGGYWITTQNGTVYAFGNAKGFGTLPALKVTPNLPVIGIVHTQGTAGYWLIAQDGGIFAFGDAGFVGSLPGLNVHVTNIVGAVPT